MKRKGRKRTKDRLDPLKKTRYLIKKEMDSQLTQNNCREKNDTRNQTKNKCCDHCVYETDINRIVC
jgi:hypothetical protein